MFGSPETGQSLEWMTRYCPSGLNNYAELMKAGLINIQSMDWPDASQYFMAGGAAFFIDASLFAPG